MAMHNPVVHLSIDMQKSFLRYLGEDAAERLTRNTSHFASALRGRGVPTVWIGYDWEDCTPLYHITEKTPFIQLADKLMPAICAGDFVCFKKTVSAMENPELAAALDGWRTERVIVTGIYTDACAGFTALDVLGTGRPCSMPIDLVSYTLLDGRTFEPVPHYAEYNSEDFLKTNRRLLNQMAARRKAPRMPDLAPHGKVLDALDETIGPQKERAALAGRPLITTAQPS